MATGALKLALAIAAAIAFGCAAPLTAAPPPDPTYERALAESRTMFAGHMNTVMSQARDAFSQASLAARVCDKERLAQHRRYLARLKANMEAEQSSWLPPYHNDFDPNLWGYVHNFLIHAIEQIDAWLKVDCAFPNVPLGTTPPPVTDGPPIPDIAEDIAWWNRLNHEEWFEQAERLRQQGLCTAWRAQLDAIERQLRRLLQNPTGPVDELESRVAAWQRLWRYLMVEVRNRPCPGPAGLPTPEQRLIEQRAEQARSADTRPPAFDQVPHRSGPPPGAKPDQPRLEAPRDPGASSGSRSPAGAPGGAPPAGSPPPPPGSVLFPTVPRRFCSEAEYWRFLNDIINPQYLRAAENAEAAARRRAEIEAQVNDYVQADKAVPPELVAQRRQAAADFAEAQRLSDEIARLRDRARKTPIVDCSKAQPPQESATSRFGRWPDSLYPRMSQAYSEFMDARARCDRAAMDSAMAELERLARMAQDAFDNIAMSYPGPFDQEPSPENNAFWEAESDSKAGKDFLARARRAQADCPRSIVPADLFGVITGAIGKDDDRERERDDPSEDQFFEFRPEGEQGYGPTIEPSPETPSPPPEPEALRPASGGEPSAPEEAEQKKKRPKRPE